MQLRSMDRTPLTLPRSDQPLCELTVPLHFGLHVVDVTDEHQLVDVVSILEGGEFVGHLVVIPNENRVLVR